MAPTKNRVTHTCTQCHKILVNKYALQNHELTHTENKPFACDFCRRSFVTRTHLEAHQRSHTGEKPYVCSTCGKSFTNGHNFRDHKRTHSGEKPFVCNQCDLSFHTRSAVGRHKIRDHFDPLNTAHIKARATAKCDVCQQQFTSAQIVRKHKASQHPVEPRPLSCNVEECGRTFETIKGLSRHKLSHSKPRQCSFCLDKFENPTVLFVHIRSKHTGEKPFGCSVPGCKSRFATQNSADKHNKAVHLGTKPHRCPHCSFACSQQGNLRTHIQRLHTNTDERPFVCDTCDKKFTNKSSLRTHIAAHIGEKPFACSECGRRFKSKAGLKNHIVSAHGVTGAEVAKRQCEICQKFVMAGGLRTHMKIHTRDKQCRPFPCEMCDKSFRSRAELNVHLILHGPKMHSCPFCSKEFHLKPKLERHLRIHTRETPVA